MVEYLDTPEKVFLNYVDLVKRMRDRQKAFYREKEPEARSRLLYEAKDLERVVDHATDDFLNPKPKPML